MNTKRALVTTGTLLGVAASALFFAAGDASAQRGGRLVVKGSDTLLPLSQQWVQAFSQKNASASINLTGGGSSTGITSLITGTCDIANASRKIRPAELRTAKGRNVIIKEYPVARDGLSIIVNPSNPMTSISLADLQRIYTGAADNWSQVGGPNVKIVAVGRDPSSGTYGFFQEDVLKNKRYRQDMISTPSNNAIVTNVANDPGGIGYVGIAYADQAGNRVKVLPVSFAKGGAAIAATAETVKSGKYPISRYLYNYTRGTPAGLAGDYLKFVRSPEGQALVTKVGYVPL